MIPRAGRVLFAVAWITLALGAFQDSRLQAASAPTALTDDDLLYREAIAIGLDRGLKRPPEDGAFRKVLIEQMKTLLSRPEREERISEADIQAYYRDHLDRFRIPGQLSFRQVFFASPREQARRKARRLLASLRAGKISSKNVAKHSDPLPQGLEFRSASEELISRRFGDRFVAEIRGLKTNQWSQPIESALGLHLIRLEKRTPEGVAPIDSVLPGIVAAISKERAAKRLDEVMAQLRKKAQNTLRHDIGGEPDRAALIMRASGSARFSA